MSQRLDFATLATPAFKALNGVRVALEQSGLPSRLRELVFLRVSQLNGCAFCIDQHSRHLLEEELPLESLLLVPVWREAGERFSARERAALEWAEVVTRVADTGVPDAAFEAVSAHFQGKELADLTVAIGLMNSYNRLGVGFRLTPGAPKKS
jgi:AhpD family alkylhydroperoxidase